MEITVSQGEWKIMELLWQSPHTLMELVEKLSKSEGWTKSTVATMVRRMEGKGLIGYETAGRTKLFHALVARDAVVADQTDNLLNRAYHGSVGLLVSAMAQRNNLTRKDIDELYAILEQAEETLK